MSVFLRVEPLPASKLRYRNVEQEFWLCERKKRMEEKKNVIVRRTVDASTDFSLDFLRMGTFAKPYFVIIILKCFTF